MAVSIKNCPKCRTMLFSDTIQCPACKHVLDAARYEEWAARTDGKLASTATETACPKCGEMVRDGLVRCWKCSTFMHQDIAAEYARMQAAPQPVIYSPLPRGSARQHGSASSSATTAVVAGDDDFELGTGFHQRPPSSEQAPPPPQDAAASGEDANGRAKAGGTDHDTPPSPDVPHSVATSGDALLQVALAEQQEEIAKRRKRKLQRLAGPRSDSAIMVFCPNGHRIEVNVKYRGMTGRCPKCKSPFFVPLPEPGETPEGTEQPAEAAKPGYGKFTQWMDDVHVHSVTPEKLKLKAGSLKPDFQLFDLAFAEDELLAAAYSKKKGAAHQKSKKTAKDREAVQEFLKNGGPVVDAPAADKFTLTAEQVKAANVVQPAAYAHESMFAGIPVFGEWHMAVRLPVGDDPASARFASFLLSGFRRFVEIMRTVYGVENLCQGIDVPLEDKFTEAKCQYSEQTLKYLENIQYYQADPEFKLQLIGRKCQACGIVVSEDSRKKEKIGGANGKAIAKAKCPKCQQKFGTLSLFTLEEPEKPEEEKKPETTQPETAAGETTETPEPAVAETAKT